MQGVHDPSTEQQYVGSQFYQPEMSAENSGLDHFEEEPPLLEGRNTHLILFQFAVAAAVDCVVINQRDFMGPC